MSLDVSLGKQAAFRIFPGIIFPLLCSTTHSLTTNAPQSILYTNQIPNFNIWANIIPTGIPNAKLSNRIPTCNSEINLNSKMSLKKLSLKQMPPKKISGHHFFPHLSQRWQMFVNLYFFLFSFIKLAAGDGPWRQPLIWHSRCSTTCIGMYL